MYQNLHFAPVARFYVGLETGMAQLEGLANPSSLTIITGFIDHVARMMSEAAGALKARIYNDDNLSSEEIIRVYTGPGETIIALTSDGIDELKDTLSVARITTET
jgi:hypothetical protein